MLNRLQQVAIYQFARLTKPRPPPIPVSLIKQDNKHLQQNAEGKTPINKELRKQDRKLDKKVSKLIDDGLEESQILELMNLKNEDEPFQFKSPGSQLDHLKQQLLLKEILAAHQPKSKEQPIPTSQPGRAPKDQHEKLLLKEKIISSLRNKTSDSGNTDNLLSQYTPNIAREAEQFKKSELQYFKDLIGGDNQESKLTLKQGRRIKKGQSYVDAMKEQKREKQARKQLAAQNRAKKADVSLKDEDNGLVNSQVTKENKSSISQYQDEDFYYKKGLREFQALQLIQDQPSILDEGNKDTESSSRARGIIIEEYLQSAIDDGFRSDMFEDSTFGRHARKMSDMIVRMQKQGLTLDEQQKRALGKELLFQEKEMREEALAYQKYLEKKKKKQKMKEVMQKIHADKLREDIEYEVDFKDRFKDVDYDPLDIEANYEKVKFMRMERQALSQPGDKKSEIHFMKTEKNIEWFIRTYFYEGFLNKNTSYLPNIQIDEIKYNRKKTLVHIFWSFQDSPFANPNVQFEQKDIQRQLDASSSYISSRMTQILGLRYGPEVRFYYNTIVDSTKQIRMELMKNKKQVVEFQIKNMKNKGQIKDKKTEDEVREKLDCIATDNIENYHNRNLLLTKSYRKAHRPPTPHKDKTKTKKKSAEQKFWDDLDRA